MKKATYLKRMKSIDRAFLDGKLPKSMYETKRKKLTKQWLKKKR